MHRAAATFACDDGIGCWYSTREEGRGTTDTLRTWLRWTFQPPSPTSLIHSSHSDMQARPTPIGQDTWARATAAPCIESQSTSMKTCLEGGEAGEGGGEGHVVSRCEARRRRPGGSGGSRGGSERNEDEERQHASSRGGPFFSLSLAPAAARRFGSSKTGRTTAKQRHKVRCASWRACVRARCRSYSVLLRSRAE